MAQRVGLLVNFLEHEVLVAVLLGLLDVPGDRLHRFFAGLSVHAEDADPLRSDDGDFALIENKIAVGIADDGGDIRRHKIFIVSERGQQRAVLADGIDGVGVV